MFPEPSPADRPKGRISGSSSKNSSELVSIPFMSLDLTPGAGNLLDEFYWEILSPWRGEPLILNTGPAPRSGTAGSILWSILEEKPHPKYYLTRKACLGILRRASERGKRLPEQLRIALEIQGGLREDDHQPNMSRAVAFAANQRDEVRDLHAVSSALGAQPGMKQQTFIANGGVPKGNGDCILTENVHENHGIDARYTGPHEVSPTISARCGTGGNNVPLVEESLTAFCISGNIVDRKPHNGGNGLGINEDVAFSLTTADRHAVFSRQRVDVFAENEVASTESARQHKDATDLVIQPPADEEETCILRGANLIRRLTPLECERLQGFPDGWTTSQGLRIPPVTRPWATVWPSPAWSTLCAGLQSSSEANAGGESGL